MEREGKGGEASHSSLKRGKGSISRGVGFAWGGGTVYLLCEFLTLFRQAQRVQVTADFKSVAMPLVLVGSESMRS